MSGSEQYILAFSLIIRPASLIIKGAIGLCLNIHMQNIPGNQNIFVAGVYGKANTIAASTTRLIFQSQLVDHIALHYMICHQSNQ